MESTRNLVEYILLTYIRYLADRKTKFHAKLTTAPPVSVFDKQNDSCSGNACKKIESEIDDVMHEYSGLRH